MCLNYVVYKVVTYDPWEPAITNTNNQGPMIIF